MSLCMAFSLPSGHSIENIDLDLTQLNRRRLMEVAFFWKEVQEHRWLQRWVEYSRSPGCVLGHLGAWFGPHWARKEKNTHPLPLENWDLLGLLVTLVLCSLNCPTCSWSHKSWCSLGSTSAFVLHLHHIKQTNKTSDPAHPDTSNLLWIASV